MDDYRCYDNKRFSNSVCQIDMERLKQYIDFIQEVEKLKSVLRTAWTSSGRQESTAEHSWRLALLAVLFISDFSELDGLKILKMCLVHDLGELYDGDISALLLPDEQEKHMKEKMAMERMLSLLPQEVGSDLLAIWNEYNENQTEEAHWVKALDKAETILQHNQGNNPPDFDYKFNLEYGKSYFSANSSLVTLRNLLDLETQKHC